MITTTDAMRIRMDAETADALKRLAAAEYRTLSNYVRIVVMQAVRSDSK